MEKKRQIYIQLLFLFLIQCSSITVIVLNSLALNSVKRGLFIANESSPQEFMLIIMGVLSFLFSTILLCFYIQLYSKVDMLAPSKKLVAFETGLSLFIIALWTTLNIITMKNFNESSSCRADMANTPNEIIFSEEPLNKLSSKVCSLVDAMITVGFITIVMWFLVLVLSVYIISEINDFSMSELFTLQVPVHPYEEKCMVVNEKVPNSTIKGDPMTKLENTLIKESEPSIASSSSTLTNDYIHKPSALKTKQNDLFFDIQFENVQLDLMLPSTSELIGTKRKKNKNTFHHVY